MWSVYFLGCLKLKSIYWKNAYKSELNWKLFKNFLNRWQTVIILDHRSFPSCSHQWINYDFIVISVHPIADWLAIVSRTWALGWVECTRSSRNWSLLVINRNYLIDDWLLVCFRLECFICRWRSQWIMNYLKWNKEFVVWMKTLQGDWQEKSYRINVESYNLSIHGETDWIWRQNNLYRWIVWDMGKKMSAVKHRSKQRYLSEFNFMGIVSIRSVD